MVCSRLLLFSVLSGASPLGSGTSLSAPSSVEKVSSVMLLYHGPTLLISLSPKCKLMVVDSASNAHL